MAVLDRFHLYTVQVIYNIYTRVKPYKECTKNAYGGSSEGWTGGNVLATILKSHHLAQNKYSFFFDQTFVFVCVCGGVKVCI